VTPTPEQAGETLHAAETLGARQEVLSGTRANLETLRLNIAPSVVPALTIAGLIAIQWYAMKAIITGKNPLEKILK